VVTALTRGANTALTRDHPQLRRVLVGLGWGTPRGSAQPFDLDASALLCGPDGKVPADSYFVFYNQLDAPAGPAASAPATGAASGQDDEQVEVDLHAVPAYVDKIVFAASIYQARERRQTFGDLSGAYVRVADLDTGTELVRYDLSHDCAGETALVFGELYRHSTGDWKFRAVGQGWSEGLEGIARDYGIATTGR
jgi:tellurium resistance protein TerD